MERVRAAVSRRLESGAHAGPAAMALSRAWGAVAAAHVARPLRWPVSGVHVVAVGGATLGGSGKTPLAIGCAAALAADGARVALIGHAYRATPGSPRVVDPDDDVRVVGDEALLAARVLAALGSRATVVVARTRQAAIDRALSDASILVLDGVAQTAPRRASVALLSVDAEHPWGAARCPPCGDLRAPVASLLRASDLVVTVRDGDGDGGGDGDGDAHPDRVTPFDPPDTPPRARHDAFVVSRGAWLGPSTRLTWPEVAAMRVGLVTTLARPARVVAFLARRGVRPVAILSSADHGVPGAAIRRRARAVGGVAGGPSRGAVDVWLTTAKCALQLERVVPGRSGWSGGDGPRGPFFPLAVIDHAVELSPRLARALHPTLCATDSDGP